MKTEAYLSDPAWKELVATQVDGRPMQLWRERPRHMLDLLDLSCHRGDLDYLVQGDSRHSFASFHQAVQAGAGELWKLGVRPGDQVLIILHNSCEIPVLQWAIWRLGAVPVFGNRWWTESEIAAVVPQLAPSLIVTDLAFELGASRVAHPSMLVGWWSLPLPEEPLVDPRLSADENDVCLIAYTAGSTGGPKGVELLHRNLIWTVQTLHVLPGGRPAEPSDPTKQKVALITTPMFHNGAIVTGIISLVDGNRMVILRGKFLPEEVLQAVEAERVTSWLAVPTMFRRVMRHGSFDDYDLSSLIAPSTGGTMVSPDLIDEIAAFLPHARDGISIAYGMTEMSFISIATASQFRERPGTVGKLVLGIEARILDPDEHGEGEIIARSGALMRGYLDAIEQPIDAEGWYHTGDLGRLDEDGFLYVTGRTKDMVIRGGENISCPHVEQVLATHPDVLEVAVTGCDDADLGEALIAFIYLRPGSGVSIRDLEAYARDRLAYFSVPSRWLLRSTALPTLPTGKIDKRALVRTTEMDQ